MAGAACTVLFTGRAAGAVWRAPLQQCRNIAFWCSTASKQCLQRCAMPVTTLPRCTVSFCLLACLTLLQVGDVMACTVEQARAAAAEADTAAQMARVFEVSRRGRASFAQQSLSALLRRQTSRTLACNAASKPAHVNSAAKQRVPARISLRCSLVAALRAARLPRRRRRQQQQQRRQQQRGQPSCGSSSASSSSSSRRHLPQMP